MKNYSRADVSRMMPQLHAAGLFDGSVWLFVTFMWWSFFNSIRFSRFMYGIDNGMSAPRAFEYAKQF